MTNERPQKDVGVRNPKKIRNEPVGARAEGLPGRVQIAPNRQNAARSHQPGRLHGQRHKRGEIDGRQDPEKQPFHLGISERRDPTAEGEARHLVEEIAMRGDELVAGFGGAREARKMIVKPGQPSHPRRILERDKNGARAGQHFASGHHQLHGLAETGGRNLGEARADLLGRCVSHLTPGELLPVLDPDPAESAAAVKDHQGLVRHALISVECRNVVSGGHSNFHSYCKPFYGSARIDSGMVCNLCGACRRLFTERG